MDLGYSDNPFTWGRKDKTSGYIVERLDTYLATNSLMELFKDIGISHTNKHNSDHKGIVASIDHKETDQGRGWIRKLIRFEETWIKFEECRDIISRHWVEESIVSLGSFTSKITRCLFKLKKWNNTRLNGSLKAAIARKEEELKALSLRQGVHNLNDIRTAELELERLLEEELKS